jgi:hypothetical protein
MCGACAYAISTRCWAVCRSERWSGLGCLPGACTTAHRFPKCVRVSRKLNEFFGPLLTCGILRALTSAAKESLLPKSTLLNVAFENLEPADLGDCFNAVRIIRVPGETSSRYPFDCAAYVSCVSLSGAPEDESETGFATVLWTGSGTDEERSRFHCIAGIASSYHCIVVRVLNG